MSTIPSSALQPDYRSPRLRRNPAVIFLTPTCFAITIQMLAKFMEITLAKQAQNGESILLILQILQGAAALIFLITVPFTIVFILMWMYRVDVPHLLRFG